MGSLGCSGRQIQESVNVLWCKVKRHSRATKNLMQLLKTTFKVTKDLNFQSSVDNMSSEGDYLQIILVRVILREELPHHLPHRPICSHASLSDSLQPAPICPSSSVTLVLTRTTFPLEDYNCIPNFIFSLASLRSTPHTAVKGCLPPFLFLPPSTGV